MLVQPACSLASFDFDRDRCTSPGSSKLLDAESLAVSNNRHVAQPYASTGFHTEGGDKGRKDGSLWKRKARGGGDITLPKGMEVLDL